MGKKACKGKWDRPIGLFRCFMHYLARVCLVGSEPEAARDDGRGLSAGGVQRRDDGSTNDDSNDAGPCDIRDRSRAEAPQLWSIRARVRSILDRNWVDLHVQKP